jgi:hypothetical protein
MNFKGKEMARNNLIGVIKKGMKIKAEIDFNYIMCREYFEAKNSVDSEIHRENITELRREFDRLISDKTELFIVEMEKALDRDKHAFCIMAIMGGPYFTGNISSFHISNHCGFGRFETILDSFVGHINLLEDVCGIDNLKILLGILE